MEFEEIRFYAAQLCDAAETRSRTHAETLIRILADGIGIAPRRGLVGGEQGSDATTEAGRG